MHHYMPVCSTCVKGINGNYFAAKTVVDHANELKNDDIQNVGAIISARFTIEAIAELLG
tara:strand:- start:3553 stop:3729 length:177 start_codon:yes stop_codon:yes gene_type:complete